MSSKRIIILLYKKRCLQRQRWTFWLSFVNPVLQNTCSQKFCKFHWKRQVLESVFTKKRLQLRCFPVTFCKFLRIPFFTEWLGLLLLERVCEGTSLVKILQFCHFNIFGILEKEWSSDCGNVCCFSCFSIVSVRCCKWFFQNMQLKHLF